MGLLGHRVVKLWVTKEVRVRATFSEPYTFIFLPPVHVLYNANNFSLLELNGKLCTDCFTVFGKTLLLSEMTKETKNTITVKQPKTQTSSFLFTGNIHVHRTI